MVICARTYLILFSVIYALFFSKIPAEIIIDPELINGLLTASSILFGILTFVLAKQQEMDGHIEKHVILLVVLLSYSCFLE